MFVGRCRGDAGAATGIGERKAIGTMFDEEVMRGGNHRLAEIPVVKTLFRAHACLFCAWVIIFFGDIGLPISQMDLCNS